MPSEKRERQRQNRASGRAADLEAARAAKKRKSTRNALIVVGVVAAIVIALAAMNSGGDDDGTDVASGGSTTTTGAGATTTTAAGGASGDIDISKVTCNETKPAKAPSDKQYDEPGDAKLDPAKTYTATLETSCGNIVIELDHKASPKSVNSFVFLAREGFYDGTKFHRVVDNFVIQGGDPTATGTGGPGYTLAEEPPADKKYHLGDFAGAKTSAPNSTGSQFFIVTGDPAPLDAAGTYTYYGKVTQGIEVAKKLESFNQGDGPPTRDLYLFKVTITES
jgi:peptidylprolyl isomerase